MKVFTLALNGTNVNDIALQVFYILWREDLIVTINETDEDNQKIALIDQVTKTFIETFSIENNDNLIGNFTAPTTYNHILSIIMDSINQSKVKENLLGIVKPIIFDSLVNSTIKEFTIESTVNPRFSKVDYNEVKPIFESSKFDYVRDTITKIENLLKLGYELEFFKDSRERSDDYIEFNYIVSVLYNGTYIKLYVGAHKSENYSFFWWEDFYLTHSEFSVVKFTYDQANRLTDRPNVKKPTVNKINTLLITEYEIAVKTMDDYANRLRMLTESIVYLDKVLKSPNIIKHSKFERDNKFAFYHHLEFKHHYLELICNNGYLEKKLSIKENVKDDLIESLLF